MAGKDYRPIRKKLKMREIKFRAWDKINKRMIFPYSIDLVRKHEGIEQGQYYFDNFAIDFDDAELMQFTGLHDKNGKEIYEDDIVKEGRAIYQVTWKNGVALEPFVSYCCNEHVEIIGNIHEHTHLLEPT